MKNFETRLSEAFKHKNILVTGGRGFIGSALIKKLKKLPCRVINPDKKDVGNKNFWKDYVNYADIIYHLAAQTSSAHANSHPSADIKINLMPIINLIEISSKSGWKPDVIFTGSVTQAGLTPTIPVNEKVKDLPLTIYDINKLISEKYLHFYHHFLHGRAVTLRLPNVYGPGPDSRKSDRGIVNQMVRRALRREKLFVYGTGKYLRDYIFIDDIIEALLQAYVNITVLSGKYFVLGTGTGHSIKKLVEIINKTVSCKTGCKSDIIFQPWPEHTQMIEKRNFVADPQAFTRLTKWQAKIDLKTGIAKTVNYFINQPL